MSSSKGDNNFFLYRMLIDLKRMNMSTRVLRLNKLLPKFPNLLLLTFKIESPKA